MAKFLVKLNPTLEIPIELIEELHKICKSYKNSISNKKSSEKTISEETLDYVSEGEEKVGSIYEHNYITKVINYFLKEIRIENKKNVLIIDDIDRIDPDHIFRILNILSAHNNNFDSKNKFDFDHIILVCDLENIKRIFYHKYGKEVDFEGYIDKFYSTHIMCFTNSDAIIAYIKSVFQTSEDKTGYLKFMALMIQSFVEQGSLSVRKILKHKYQIDFEKFILYEQSGLQEDTFYMHRGEIDFIENLKNLYVDSGDLPILNFFKLMTFIFGDFNDFYDSLCKLKSSKDSIQYKDFIDLISFLALQNHISTKSGDELFFTMFREQASGANHLASVGWPGNTFSNKNFKINLKWNAGNRYSSLESYFNEAKAYCKEAEYEKTETIIKLSFIFEAVEKIAHSCAEFGYLEKAGIHFNRINL